MRRFALWLQDRWFSPSGAGWLLALLPVAGFFFLLVYLRRILYRYGTLPQIRLPVPVVIIGNLTVGGAGKTPLTLALAKALTAAGWHPGIISRGYGGKRNEAPCPVHLDTDPASCGDEPLLLARRTRLPVWVGRNRAAAGALLLAARPEVDLLLCDDGLQHYQLARDLEIAVFDARGIGNGWLLPAGPLRELPSRLRDVSAIVLQGDGNPPPWLAALKKPVFSMNLEPGAAYALSDPTRRRPISDFRGHALHAVAGIGHPARFFTMLDASGLVCQPHPFPDHHAYRAEDFAFAQDGATILMTEKDGVKCARFNLPNAWVLPVRARLSPDLLQLLIDTLEKLRDGRKTS
jgi:tetraacyldisaccharide 4'-kinase